MLSKASMGDHFPFLSRNENSPLSTDRNENSPQQMKLHVNDEVTGEALS